MIKKLQLQSKENFGVKLSKLIFGDNITKGCHWIGRPFLIAENIIYLIFIGNNYERRKAKNF